MSYSFYFDSSACSGCKACQIACKDKHQLPVGVLWRRVYEVTGGDWTRRGKAWLSDVFAYNLSVACNHCARAICVEVCPSRALTQRADGIVLLDADKCLGCKYCSWACPYDALQYDARSGRMTKCTLCADNIDEHRPPACVAACPLRALELRSDGVDSAAIFPLPDSALTHPSLTIKPHAQAGRANAKTAHIANREEVSREEICEEPLIAFTLLAQMAVGTFWISTLLGFQGAWAVGGLMLLALFASLFHLGAPLNAWRAVANLGSSWLSREIFCATLFTGASFAVAFTGRDWVTWIALLLGLGLIVSMAQAYRLRTIPVWNTWRTLVAFLATAVLLGAFSIALLLAFDPTVASSASRLSFEWLMLVAMIAWVGAFVGAREPYWRLWLTLGAVVLLAATALLADQKSLLTIATIFSWELAVGSEAIGRWGFYARRIRKQEM